MILGIDLGTSNSMAAVYKDGEVKLIPTSLGDYITPSVVNVDDSGNFIVGKVAKERKTKEPLNTVDKFKRNMGTDHLFNIGNMQMRAEELSAVVLKSLKTDAEKFLGEEVADAVISVPAFFNNPQREAVLRAGALAGLNVRKIINEPTSAALAYGVGNVDNEEERAIIVLDLGGGTFDISIMETCGYTMEVIAICGDNKLGGNDFTEKIVELFKKANKINQELTEDEKSILWKLAEKAKISISTTGSGAFSCNLGGKEYSYEISEEEYEKECFELLEKIRHLTIRAIDESGYKTEEIKDIIMVGGGTKLSIVKKMMERMLDKELAYQINPDEAVVRGAAMQGALIEHNEDIKELVMTDICPYYILYDTSIWSSRGDSIRKPNIIIPKNTTIPTKHQEVKTLGYGMRTITLYQSEDKYGINRVEIGKCKYIVPKVEDNSCKVYQNTIYDNNGIMRFEVYIPDIDKTYGTTIVSDGINIDEEEANKRLEGLKNITLAEWKNNENELLLAQAENAYTEATGRLRDAIGYAISDFEAALKTNKKNEIKEYAEKLRAIIG